MPNVIADTSPIQYLYQTNLLDWFPLTDLGKGEKEVLALAIEIPDFLALLDDGLARRYANLLGIKLTRTMGILLKAKQNGYLHRIEPILNQRLDFARRWPFGLAQGQLELLKFRLDATTRTSVLKLAGEG
jgi:predicted nucleic acid-binding protein